MTKLGLQPYRGTDGPPRESVPVSVIVLTRDEEANIRSCLSSVAWADQVVVIDSGSTDNTVSIALSNGADVVEQPWFGFSAQRELALRLSLLKHDWVYFVDADQWVTAQLAQEVADRLRVPSCAAFAHRFRLVFQGTWIRHCGWYNASWNVQLMDRRYAKYDGNLVGERVKIDGPIGRLKNDIVDDSRKGLADWLRKHVGYAELTAQARGKRPPMLARISRLKNRDDIRPLSRVLLKDIIFPSVPAKPAAIFCYMYVVRLGILDGVAGLRFCIFHAWYELTVATLREEMAALKDE
jgi:glycosyltransferase involved in cell wall biosynthesis